MTTVEEIYAAINPLPAMLSAKGKVKPAVSLLIEANASIAISMNWVKPHARTEWDHEYKTFVGANFEDALAKAQTFVRELPSAEQAKLHDFMGALGKLIDDGRSAGIEVDYMNPLLDTMKRLSENVITYRPSAVPRAQRGGGEA